MKVFPMVMVTSGWTMCSVLETRPVLPAALTQDLKYIIVITMRMLEWHVIRVSNRENYQFVVNIISLGEGINELKYTRNAKLL